MICIIHDRVDINWYRNREGRYSSPHDPTYVHGSIIIIYTIGIIDTKDIISYSVVEEVADGLATITSSNRIMQCTIPTYTILCCTWTWYRIHGGSMEEVYRDWQYYILSYGEVWATSSNDELFTNTQVQVPGHTIESIVWDGMIISSQGKYHVWGLVKIWDESDEYWWWSNQYQYHHIQVYPIRYYWLWV